MAKLMEKNKDKELSARQVEILKRVIIDDGVDGLVSMVNPKIIWRRGKGVMSAGCFEHSRD